MNADTLIKALDEATRAPGALELQLAANGKQLQDLGLSWPDRDSLARLLDAMDKAAALLEGYGKYVVGTPVEVEDLRAYFKIAAAICDQGVLAEGIATLAKGERLMPKDRIERWDALASTFREWARQVAGCKPSEAAAAPVPASGQETAQVSTTTPAVAPNPIYRLITDKTTAQLRRIFAALARAGYIAEADPAGVPMQQPFLDAFNLEGSVQGRIIWEKKGKNKQISKAQLCDFLLYFGVEKNMLAEYAAAIFGVELKGRALSDGQIRNPRNNRALIGLIEK